MYNMPYGVVEKLKSLNWKIDKHNSSGRTLFCFPNHSNWYIIDNGILGGNRWIFLSMFYGNDFEFGNKYWPIEIIFTPKNVKTVRKIKVDNETRKLIYDFSYEDYENLKILLDAYHVERKYFDERPAYFDKLVDYELQKIENFEKDIESCRKKIDKILKEKEFLGLKNLDE